MLKKRIIPCLDINNGRVVKGINFVNLVDAGDPAEQAKIYNDNGADEICFLDISATDFIKEIKNFGISRIIYTDIYKDGTKQGPNIKGAIELSSKAKIPLVISGGVSSIEDVERIKSLNNPNIEGVIIGKAIYDSDIKISDLAKLI